MGGLNTAADEAPVLDTSLTLPYTLTTGRAAGTFLAELANQRIVGSRCSACPRVLVPAQDYCAECGEAADEFVTLPHSGTVTAFTTTKEATLALIRLDGADGDLLHRIADPAGLEVGSRVTAVWADQPEGSILDLAAFALAASGDPSGPPAVTELETTTEPIVEKPYRLNLEYRHSYGPYYGRFFDELGSSRRILGVQCPSCNNVLVPPRAYCDACFVRTERWVDVSDHGRIQGMSVINLEFVGQLREPPYIYAEIMLDGCATRLIHSIGGIEIDQAKEKLRPGTRVRAVWTEHSNVRGTLEDIVYFEPVPEDG